jgi:prepilin-type N-terminal cleavage/methylation domain-containing protein
VPTLRRPPPSSRRGVGLVELMIAVALIAVIASVAIPRYLDLRRRAMRAEVVPMLRSIGLAQQSWQLAHGGWRSATPNPSTPVSGILREFEDQPDWQALSWRPDGKLRCSYSATLLDGGERVRVDALCDLDGDRQVAILRHEVASSGSPGTFQDLYPERY